MALMGHHRSPCRLRRKVDDLMDQVESLQKKLNISQKKKHVG